MNVVRIHPNVAPRLNVTPHQPLRGLYWRTARDHWTAAKEARAQRHPIAADILASARQALSIATAVNPKATLDEILKEERKRASQELSRPACFTENLSGQPISGTPVPLRCPFCGDPCMTSIVKRAGGPKDKYPTYFVTCEGCGAEGPSGATQLEAAQVWNRRPAGGAIAS